MYFHKKPLFLIAFLFLFTLGCSEDEERDAPNFDIDNYSISIPENPFEGEVIGTIPVPEDLRDITFSIATQQPDGAVEINAVGGQLKVLDSTLFDYDVRQSIIVRAKVLSGVRSSTVFVTINLIDLDDPIYYVGNVVLLTQEEVNEFGSRNYSDIQGSLTIGNDSGIHNNSITDLTPLSNINSVSGSFTVQYNDQLETLAGTEQIKELNDDLFIRSNKGLKSFNISEENTRFKKLEITGNDELVSLNGLFGLTETSRWLKIEHNNSLNSIAGLQNVVNIDGELIISDNPSLENLNGLSNLASINGELAIQNNTILNNVDGLNNLNSVRNELKILSNDALLNIEGLSNLNTFSGSGSGAIVIAANQSLTSLNGLQGLGSTFQGSISIEGNASLQNLIGLEEFTSVSGLRIYANSSLSSLEGAENLSSILEELNISKCYELNNIDALSNLQTVSKVQLESNTLLSSLAPLNGVLSEMKLVEIRNSPSLSAINAFNSCPSVAGVVITQNEGMIELDAFLNTNTASDQITIENNPLLTELNAFENLTSVGTLNINSNATLTNFCDLELLILGNGIAESYTIKNNAYNPTQQDFIDGNCSL